MAKRTKKPVVYVVVADTSHEGATVLRAFGERGDADTFKKVCDDYTLTQPEPARLDAPDDVYDRWWRKQQRWEKRHPAGEAWQCEDFVVLEVPFVPVDARGQT